VLITFLWASLDVFAWQISDMPGISIEIIEHKLDIDPSYKPIKQKERKKIYIRETWDHPTGSQ
jgi:hypothetical protein